MRPSFRRCAMSNDASLAENERHIRSAVASGSSSHRGHQDVDLAQVVLELERWRPLRHPEQRAADLGHANDGPERGAQPGALFVATLHAVSMDILQEGGRIGHGELQNDVCSGSLSPALRSSLPGFQFVRSGGLAERELTARERQDTDMTMQNIVLNKPIKTFLRAEEEQPQQKEPAEAAGASAKL